MALAAVAILCLATLPPATLLVRLPVTQVIVLDVVLANLAVWCVVLAMMLVEEATQAARIGLLMTRRLSLKRSGGLLASHIVL